MCGILLTFDSIQRIQCYKKNETVEPPACMLLHRMLPLVLDTRFLDLDFRNFENNLLNEIFPLYENHKTLDCE